MKRIALIVTCLAVLAGIAWADEVASERTMLVIETTWINLHEPSALPQPVANDDIEAPPIMVLTDITEEEVTTLKAAGTVTTEPYLYLMNGRAGSAGHRFDAEDGRGPYAGGGAKCLATVLPGGDFSVQLDFWSYDRRAQAAEAETSLRALVRVADGETILLARVGEDGAILNPVYLLTARVVRDAN